MAQGYASGAAADQARALASPPGSSAYRRHCPNVDPAQVGVRTRRVGEGTEHHWGVQSRRGWLQVGEASGGGGAMGCRQLTSSQTR
jgi:hypothetical protein